jgi:hypothetical protein
MAPRNRKEPDLYHSVQWHPPGREFWITPDMIVVGKKGESKPWFSTHTVATVFIGRSAAWLRVRMRTSDDWPDSELVLDGTWKGMYDIHRSATGDRQFSLRDIELTAHALRRSGSIDEDRFVCMIMSVVWCARQYGLLAELRDLDE